MLALAATWSRDARAADDEEAPTTIPTPRLFDPEKLRIQPPGHVAPLRFGGLLTVDAAGGADSATDRNDGFELSDGRLLVEGLLEGGFDYRVQGDLTQSRVLVDLALGWAAPRRGFATRAGYYRTPFSGGFQIPDAMIDFIDRAQVVELLAPGRQIGLEVDQSLWGEALVVRAGLFNGDGLEANQGRRFLYTLRLEGTLAAGPWQILYGANAAYSDQEDLSFAIGAYDPFDGSRWIAGADLRITRGAFFFSAESLHATLDPSDAALRRDRLWGYQLSVGWEINRLIQLLARYDAFRAGSLPEDRDLAIASLVLNFTKIVSLQTELRLRTRGQGPAAGAISSLNFTF